MMEIMLAADLPLSWFADVSSTIARCVFLLLLVLDAKKCRQIKNKLGLISRIQHSHYSLCSTLHCS